MYSITKRIFKIVQYSNYYNVVSNWDQIGTPNLAIIPTILYLNEMSITIGIYIKIQIITDWDYKLISWKPFEWLGECAVR